MAFGKEDYNSEEVIDLDEMFNADDWDAKPSSSPLEPGKYQLRLTKFEKGTNDKGSVWFNFFFQPYATEDGTLLEGFPTKINVRKYFYIGNNSSGKMETNSYSVNFTNFLQSCGITKNDHAQKFNQAWMEGILVWGDLVLGERQLNKKPDPITGNTYTEIDPNDANSYVQYLEFNDKTPVIAVRDSAGNVRKVY